jgi:broad specificity phosphatase PhoE
MSLLRGMAGPHTLYLIRHGESVANRRGLIAGVSDAPLSLAGVRQMRAVEHCLAGKTLAAVYSSPLRRAAEPARELAAARGLPHREIMDFCEIDFGDWEGRSRAEVAREHPELSAQAAAGEARFTFPNGENVDGFRRRVQSAFAFVARDMPGPAALYAHGGTIRMILAAVMGTTFSEAQKIDLSPGGICVLEPRGGSHTAASLNDYAHLPPPG